MTICNRTVRGDILGGLVGGLIVAAAVIAWLHFSPAPIADQELTGVPSDFLAEAEIAYAAYPEAFRVADGQENETKNARLYEACPALWPGPQQTDDCVSMGLGTATYARQCVKARIAGLTPPKSRPYEPYLYGIARVQIGNRRPPCGIGGAYPSYAVRGFKQFGFIDYSEAPAPYSGRIADQWGCNGPPRAMIDAARDQAGGDAYPIRSIEEWRDALCNGYPVTVAIPWTPGRVYRGHDGRSCLAFDGKNVGGHQICSLAYDGSSGKPYWLINNSHGPNWPKGANRSDGIPPGSVWVDEHWARWIISKGELWAINDVPGFERQEIDWSVFDLAERIKPRIPVRQHHERKPADVSTAALAL